MHRLEDLRKGLQHGLQAALAVRDDGVEAEADSSRSVLSLTWGTRLTSAFCASVLFLSIEWLEMKLVP